MGFLAHFNLYVLRNSINVAIVAMVNSTEEVSDSDYNETDYDCPDRGQSITAKPVGVSTFVSYFLLPYYSAYKPMCLYRI